MSVSRSSKSCETAFGVGVFAPVPAEEFYEAVLDVRGFPAWAPGVRRVEILANVGEPGMLSEWEVSVLGVRRRVLSVLEVAEAPRLLRWTYDGPVTGWGECSVGRIGNGTLAEFRTALRPTDPLVAELVRSGLARDVARDLLKRSLGRLGRLVAGEADKVSVGPASVTGIEDPAGTGPTLGQVS